MCETRSASISGQTSISLCAGSSGPVCAPIAGVLLRYAIIIDVTGTAPLAIADPSVAAAPGDTKAAWRTTARKIARATYASPGWCDPTWTNKQYLYGEEGNEKNVGNKCS